jgi:hypothetical protein
MSWQVHYQRSEQQFHAPAADRSTAIAIACILIRDGHDVIKLVSTAGETIETDEIKRLLRPVTPLGRWFRGAAHL